MKRLNRWSAIYIVAVIGFVIVTVGPFIWAFLVSVTPEYEMFQRDASMIPHNWTWANYKELLWMDSAEHIRLFRGISNSVRTIIVTILIGVPIAVISSYALSRLKFRGAKLSQNILLFTMVIPVFATIIPLYKIFATYKLLNDHFWLSIVYVTSFLPMNIWLISNYFRTIPKELEEAAKVDGANAVQVFLCIILPNALPVVLASTLIMFLSGWSQFQVPLVLASSTETKPIAIVTSEFMTKDSIQYGLTAAAGLIAVLPPMVIALLFRKYLISDVMQGSVKF